MIHDYQIQMVIEEGLTIVAMYFQGTEELKEKLKTTETNLTKSNKGNK